MKIIHVFYVNFFQFNMAVVKMKSYVIHEGMILDLRKFSFKTSNYIVIKQDLSHIAAACTCSPHFHVSIL